MNEQDEKNNTGASQIIDSTEDVDKNNIFLQTTFLLKSNATPVFQRSIENPEKEQTFYDESSQLSENKKHDESSSAQKINFVFKDTFAGGNESNERV